jgi:putative oxidoreductase
MALCGVPFCSPRISGATTLSRSGQMSTWSRQTIISAASLLRGKEQSQVTIGLVTLSRPLITLSMILSWLSQYRDLGLLFLRAGTGTMMVLHGWPKLAGGIQQWEKLGKATSHIGINFFPGFWGFSSAMVETIGGVLIVLGFCFRPVTILMTLNFIVPTVFLYKTTGQFLEWSRPAEMVILFFSLIFIGAGKYSIDRS